MLHTHTGPLPTIPRGAVASPRLDSVLPPALVSLVPGPERGEGAQNP